jgi:uncharacterized protein YdeI (YjbR/CyaY-like superfamily)
MDQAVGMENQGKSAEQPIYFATSDEFRAWLEENHASAQELWVGFYRKGSRKPSITGPEAVDQALCFGWIDSIRRSVDGESYTNRFTPRRPRSNWSAVNIKRVQELTEAGLMRPAGIAAFGQRTEDRSAVYSYEQKNVQLPPEYEEQFRANGPAWDYFQAQAPWYRKTATRWVVSAKREETRQKRLATLIEDSERGRTIAPLTRGSAREQSKTE